MPSPPPREQAGSSSSSEINSGPSQSSSKSILSFWGAASDSSHPPSPAASAQPKRKRRKADDGSAQGRITLTQGGGTVWGVGKAGETEIVNGGAKNKGKGKMISEEDELKEMTKKAKKATLRSKGTKGKIVNRTSGTALEAIPASPEIIQISSSDPYRPDSPVTFPPTFSQRRLQTTTSGTLSASSRGAADDPIDIEEDNHKLGPKKLVFAADTKPAHSFFSKGTINAINIGKPESVASDAAPSETTKSAAKAVNGKQPAKPHAFFSMNGTKDIPGKEKSGWGNGVREGEEWLTPLPGGLWPNSEPIAGPSNYRSSLLRRANRPNHMDGFESHQFWSDQDRPVASSKAHSGGPTSAKEQSRLVFIDNHPAIQSVSHRNASSNRETWAERYRPIEAEQVLGNEVEAVYLRDWLQELSVGGLTGEKRTVHRKVKRFKPQLLDGWIVDDAGLFGDPFTQTEAQDEIVEYIEYEEPYLPLGRRPMEYPPLATAQLTNCMLIVGPHGSGKSAAVYAAATELDWEVFEVYPGMGKRTAASLMSWVGDVGKNHLVVKSGKGDKPAEKKNPIKSFFGQNKQTLQDENDSDDIVALPGSQGSRTDPIAVDHSPTREDRILDTNEVNHEVRQSLILIDEADILFAEENTFWPAIISLIAESRRPVVITCNDLGPVPQDSLPLQAILHFQAPPSYIAIPYLERVARKQNIIDPCYAADMYRRTTFLQPDLPDYALPPNGNEPLPHFDLRRALTQMQLEKSHAVQSVDERSVIPAGFEDMVRRLEDISWIDARISPGSRITQDLVEVDRFSASGDDELGKRLLLKPDIHDIYPVIPAYEASTKISEEIKSLSGISHTDERDLCTDRIKYVRSLLPLLDPLIPLSAPLLPSSSLFVLYMPVLRDMVEWDDTYQAMEEQAVARGEGRVNRKTGRPKRTTVGGGQGYGRYLDNIEEDGLKAARDSKLVW